MHVSIVSDIHSDPGLETFLRNGVARRQEAGMLKPTYCRVCRRLLSHPASILAGIGPECIAIERCEAEQGERFPAGCEVRVIAGAYEGAIGVVGTYTPRRKGRTVKAPFLVHFGGFHARYRADQLERVESGVA